MLTGECKHSSSYKRPRGKRLPDCQIKLKKKLSYFSRMSSVSLGFNLQYEMISETTSLIAVVLLVVALLLVVRTRSYRECFRSQGVGKLRTKPVPEENGEKNSDQVKTVFIWRDKLIMFWIFFFTLILYRLVCFVVMASCAQGHAVSEWLDEWVKGERASMLTVGLTPSENGDIRHEIETYFNA